VLLLAPLPGVQEPAGEAGTIPSGSAAVRVLMGYGDEMTSAGERDVMLDGTLRGASVSGTFAAVACGPPDGPPDSDLVVRGTWEAHKT